MLPETKIFLTSRNNLQQYNGITWKQRMFECDGDVTY